MRPGPATFTGLCGVSLEIWGDTAVINGRSGRLAGVGGFWKGQWAKVASAMQDIYLGSKFMRRCTLAARW